MSRKVGCAREFAAYFADATKPHTVAFSPMWLAASAGLMDAAPAESAQKLNATAAPANLVDCIVVSVHPLPSHVLDEQAGPACEKLCATIDARSEHRPGADTPDHFAVTGCRLRARRRRSVADTVHDRPDAIAGTDHGLAVSGQRWSCLWCPAPSTSALLNHGGLIGVDHVARCGLIARLHEGQHAVQRDTWDAVIAAGRRWRDRGCGLLGCRATGQSANNDG